MGAIPALEQHALAAALASPGEGQGDGIVAFA